MRTVGLILPPEEPAYICPHCGKNYKSEASLTKHLQDKHPDLTEGLNDAKEGNDAED